MDRAQGFFLGFGITMLVTWLSTLLAGSWTSTTKTYSRIFSDIPQPNLKDEVITTNIGQSPIQVLFDGCLNIIVQILIQIILLGAIGAVIWVGIPEDLPLAFLVGLFLAAIIGFLLQNFTKNWKKISNLRKTLTGSPSVTLKKAEGNSHYVAAKPPRPAFDIVLYDSIEIVWRFALEIALLYLLATSFFVAYTYLSEGEIQVPLYWIPGS